MKLGCIGYGNMAAAILNGVHNKNLLPAQEICVYDPLMQKQEDAKQKGFTVMENESTVAQSCHAILLAVKPNNFPDILSKIKSEITSNTVLISIAAGISIANIEKGVQQSVPVVRTMPNTPLMLGAGTTAICKNEQVKPDDFTFARDIFACAGTVYELPESQFDHVINLNGSSPAYIYLFSKIIADFAHNKGDIPSDIALDMIADTLIGAAKMLKSSGKTPDELITAVSSPGGTTVAVLEAFQQEGFACALEKGLAACVKRAKELGEMNNS